MRFAVRVEQNVSRLNVAMEDSVFVCVMNRARYFGDYFRRLSHRHWRTANHFIKLAAFDELHAEVAGAVTLAHFVDGNDARVIKTCGGCRSPCLLRKSPPEVTPAQPRSDGATRLRYR